LERLAPETSVPGTTTGGGVDAPPTERPAPLPPSPPPETGALLEGRSATSADSQSAQALTSGETFKCEARSGSSVWPCTFRVSGYTSASGTIVGELTWPTLKSVHRIRGELEGNTLTFAETEAVQRGRARLNVGYEMTIGASGATGSWLDKGDGSRGTMTITRGGEQATGATNPGGPAVTTPATPASSAGVLALTSGRTFSCEARSGSSVWPCTLRITAYTGSSGAIAGEMTWTTLSSVHRISGKLEGTTLTFTETEAIRSGRAHLNVAYTAAISDGAATGTWVDPADGSRGSLTILVGAPAAALQAGSKAITSPAVVPGRSYRPR